MSMPHPAGYSWPQNQFPDPVSSPASVKWPQFQYPEE